MSHTAETRTIIKKVNEEVLQEALELIAKVTPGIEINKKVGTYEGGHLDVDIAVHTPGMPRGIGLKFRGVEGLSFVGDGYGVTNEYNTMRRLILMTYQTVAAQKATAMIGYTANIVAETNRAVRLEAVHA